MPRLSGPRVVLETASSSWTREFDRLVGELRTLAAGGLAGHRVYRALRARKELAELAVAAVWLELEAAGGAGYLSESETARRLREAAFFPVQSPSLVQLRSGAGAVRGVAGESTCPRPGGRGGRLVIEIVGAGKEYRMGDRTVLAFDGVDLTVRRGEIVALVGPSGCGKSSLAKGGRRSGAFEPGRNPF